MELLENKSYVARAHQTTLVNILGWRGRDRLRHLGRKQKIIIIRECYEKIKKINYTCIIIFLIIILIFYLN